MGLQGSDDPGLACAERAAAVPDCHVELFEGAGHFPHLDDPDRFARLLREFIASGSAPEQDAPGSAQPRGIQADESTGAPGA